MSAVLPTGGAAAMQSTQMRTDEIQKMLDENYLCIKAILENQNLGRLTDVTSYQNKLQHNLMKLAEVADKQQAFAAPQAAQPQAQAAAVQAAPMQAVQTVTTMPGAMHAQPLGAAGTQQLGITMQAQQGMHQLGAAGMVTSGQLPAGLQQQQQYQAWQAK